MLLVRRAFLSSSSSKRLVLRPFVEPRALAKALGIEPARLLREAGYECGPSARKKKKITLRHEENGALGLMPQGHYRAPTMSAALVPCETALALAAKYAPDLSADVVDPVTELADAAALAVAETTTDKTNAVVGVLAHVDHGKTTLLDALFGSSVAAAEAGGITQSNRASRVLKLDDDVLAAFLDTPGHSAFASMRGAAVEAADLALVLVAADAGLQSQTREALQRCAEAQIPVLLALTKIDAVSDDATFERVAAELRAAASQPVDAPVLGISATENIGLDELKKALSGAIVAALKARRLKGRNKRTAPPVESEAAPPSGVALVVELSRQEPGFYSRGGAVVLCALRAGELRKGDWISCGSNFGRVRAMHARDGEDDAQEVPLEVASAGDLVKLSVAWSQENLAVGDVLCVVGEQRATEIAEYVQAVRKFLSSRTPLDKEEEAETTADVKGGNAGVIKAASFGALEAVLDYLEERAPQLKLVSDGLGALRDAEIEGVRAARSEGHPEAAVYLLGFKADTPTRKRAAQANVPIRHHEVYHELLDDILTRNGLPGPTPEEATHSRGVYYHLEEQQ